ncbi:MAG: hypothetical protein A370_03569 [Clostridium sp. Maddingley MBC34-26]|nr:MAG: hypothetical protein A370_03569 [Clostridium sp. Maddingley MBC34-26]
MDTNVRNSVLGTREDKLGTIITYKINIGNKER